MLILTKMVIIFECLLVLLCIIDGSSAASVNHSSNPNDSNATIHGSAASLNESQFYHSNDSAMMSMLTTSPSSASTSSSARNDIVHHADPYQNQTEVDDTVKLHNQSLAFRQWLYKTLQVYDKRLRPSYGGRPLTIKLGLFLISISSFVEQNMEFTVELFFHEVWRDDRLKFDPETFGGRSILTLPLDAPSVFWVPDTSFLNALRSQSPVEGSISHLHYMKLSSNGTMFYSRRLSVTAECQIDLTMYPFDQQACRLELSSYGSTVEDIVYEWSLTDDAIPIRKIDLPDFYATTYVAKVINRSYVAGRFSVPHLCIELKRRSGFCFLQLFVPATAVVGSSWISLWLENETQFADMVAVILAIIFLSYSYNTVMPKVSYVKAMDIYLAACFIFAFLSLVKLAIVKHMHLVVNKRRIRRRSLISSPAAAIFQVTSLMNAARHASITNLTVPGQGTARKITNNNDPSSASTLVTPITDTACGASGSQQEMTTIQLGGLDTMDRQQAKGDSYHDSYWRCMKAFHVASQLTFPLAFIAFGIFYFFVYPHVQQAGGFCT